MESASDTDSSEEFGSDTDSSEEWDSQTSKMLQELAGGESDMAWELRNEQEVLQTVHSLEVIQANDQLVKMLKSMEKITDKILLPSYEDITNMLSNGAVFLVDGDSLLLHLMGNKNYDTSNGGQILHLIYLCERFLQLFHRKGGCFEITFFNIWNQVWTSEPTLLFARAVLMHHLKFNMSFIVHEFESVWDRDFEELLQKCKFGFMLVDYSMIDVLEELFHTENYQELIYHVHICYCLVGLSLGIVDMNGVELNVSTLNAFYTPPRATLFTRNLSQILNIVIYKLELNSQEICSASKEQIPYIPDMKEEDLRHVITVQAAIMYLKDKTSPEPKKEWIGVFLVYSALLECLPLDLRGYSNLSMNPVNEYYRFVEKMQHLMNHALQRRSQNENCNFQNVADLWHGNLLAKVIDHLTSLMPTESIHPGEQIMAKYKKLLDDVTKISEDSLDILCDLKNLRVFNKKIYEVPIARSKEDRKSTYILWPVQLIPTSCTLTKEFCKDLIPDQLENNCDETLQLFIKRNADFNENHHWHSKKPLTDDYERVNENAFRRTREVSKYSYHMSLYGASIEGRPLSSRPIVSRNEKPVCKNKKENKKNQQAAKKKEPKQSKAAIKIIEDKRKADEKLNKEADSKFLKQFKSKYEKNKLANNYKSALIDINCVLKQLKTEEMCIEGLIVKVGILWHLWTEECEKNLIDKRDLYYAKCIFLVLRDLLRKSKNYNLEEKSSKLVGKYFRQLGFDIIAEKWDLQNSKHSEVLLPVGMSWVEFQLNELGPDMEREVGKVPDNRVEGFIPDDWQRELFDHIDKRHSVLVVAPTSSGKTYASYYCMEEVLREGNNGVVVYVAPTKALVNQVAATVYARFKNKNMPEGKSVYGVFTRDYRMNALNCQILITVPQCLEILLLSPRRHDWVKSLRYVIFDEIHCLAGQAGGFSWESGLLMIQCPFLALSATIKDPSDLHMWFQSMQDFKKSQDIINNCVQPADTYEVKLVVYADRHADLRKHVYTEDGKFQHIHPYAYLDDIHFEKGSVIPTSITLSPEEVNQLYKAMDSVSPKDPCLQKLKPELYFSRHTDGFLSRKAVREYERKLRELLENWANENDEAFANVVRQLRSQSEQSISELSERCFIVDKFIDFIESLKNRNMLPAILFSYNRVLVRYLFQEATEYYELLVEKHKENLILDERKQSNVQMEKEPKRIRNAQGQFDFGVRRIRGKNKYEKTLDLITTENIKNFCGLTAKQVGHADETIVYHVEKRMLRKGIKPEHPLPRGMRMGIGMHHGGMNAVERSSVEMLFRMKVLNIVLATGTLALGIHMPCKTVAVVGDSKYLNPLEFQQMSGRAGRRGFDTAGNVVFMGLNERKMKSLMLGSLPKMIGNIPLNVSMVLQLLLLANNVTSRNVHTQEGKSCAVSRALTMLNCCLVYESIPELKGQMKHFFAFSTQFLMLQGLLDDAGKPQFLTGIVTHLRYHEPGNIAFVFLMKSGALRKLCRLKDGKVSQETQLNLITVLSYLFAPIFLHKQNKKQKYDNSKVILPHLPSYIKQVLEEYNEQVHYIFHNYLKSVSENLEDDKTLPLSGIKIEPKENFDLYNRDHDTQTLESCIVRECEPRKVCSSFAALSGHTDEEVYTHQDSSNIRHQVFTDMKFVPTVELNVELNGYAWDFYNHGIATAIRRDNGLKEGEDFAKLKDFMMVLQCIQTSLTELEPLKENDGVLKTFTVVTNNFAEKFQKAYYVYHN